MTTGYVGKPEPQYYVQSGGSNDNPVKQFLLGSTMGLPQAINQVLGYHIIRSTRPCRFAGSGFLSFYNWPRGVAAPQDYPDPSRRLGVNQWWLLRARELWHLRLEQYLRYFSDANATAKEIETKENTRDSEYPTVRISSARLLLFGRWWSRLVDGHISLNSHTV